MKLKHGKENVEKEMKGKQAKTPKLVHSRKAPLIAGLITATALTLGACSVRDEKPVENKKGGLVTETEGCKKMKAELAEIKKECSGEVDSDKCTEEKLGDYVRESEKSFEKERDSSPAGVNVMKIADGLTCKDPYVVLSSVISDKHDILVEPNYLLGDPRPIEKSGVITVKNVAAEESAKLAQKIMGAINTFWKNTPMGPAGERTHFKGSIGKLEYENGILKITVDVTVVKAEIPETKMTKVDSKGIEAALKAEKMTVKEGDYLPISIGTTLRNMRSPKVAKIDENGITVILDVEIFKKMGCDAFYVPYGTYGVGDKGALIWEFKVEKGKNPGEAVVTVKTTAPKE